MAIHSLRIKITGTAPLLCSNVMASDPLSKACKQKEHFTGRGKKKDCDHIALRAIDFIQSGYWMVEGTTEVNEADNSVSFYGYSDPYLPSSNFQRCIRNAATKWSLGKDTLRAIVVTNNPPIEYDGPKDAVQMYSSKTPSYQLVSFVKRGVWVNRVCLPTWSLSYELDLDDELLSMEQLHRILHLAGKGEGLGTWRPRYGRFMVDAIKEIG